MKSTDMPWRMTSQYTDPEPKALRACLMRLPGNKTLTNNCFRSCTLQIKPFLKRPSEHETRH